uniref:hypothetical protein n=1 Tax=Nocardia asiatica TaxID=209252 RepID=UPI0024540FBD
MTVRGPTPRTAPGGAPGAAGRGGGVFTPGRLWRGGPSSGISRWVVVVRVAGAVACRVPLS